MARQPSSISRKKKGAGICAVSLLCLWTLHAVADEPDYDLTNLTTKQLKGLKKNPLPVFSKTAGLGVVELEKGEKARWNQDAVVLIKVLGVLGWASSSSINLKEGDVFVNVGPTVVKVGDSELKKGEYALYSAKKFKKVTLLELGEKSKEAEPAKPEIDPEILAASKRTQAKSILKSNKSAGKQRLEAIVNEFEGTAAAKEAQKLLKEE